MVSALDPRNFMKSGLPQGGRLIEVTDKLDVPNMINLINQTCSEGSLVVHDPRERNFVLMCCSNPSLQGVVFQEKDIAVLSVASVVSRLEEELKNNQALPREAKGMLANMYTTLQTLHSQREADGAKNLDLKNEGMKKTLGKLWTSSVRVARDVVATTGWEHTRESASDLIKRIGLIQSNGNFSSSIDAGPRQSQ